MLKPMFSIVTPTYNRAGLLQRVFDSLKTCGAESFEWVVVDDGSVDDTEELVKGFQKALPQKVKYYRKENEGKHTALNVAFDHICGELTVILDSDDTLNVDALSFVKEIWEKVGGDSTCAGVIGLCGYLGDQDKVVGDRFPFVGDFSTITKNMFFYGLRGDKCDFVRTEYINKFRLPNLEGQRFVPESLVTYELDRKYKYYCVNRILKLVEYQGNGITNNYRLLSVKYPNGFFLRFRHLIHRDFLAQMSLFGKIKVLSNFFRYLMHSAYPFVKELRATNISNFDKLLIPLSFAIGTSYFLMDKIQYSSKVRA